MRGVLASIVVLIIFIVVTYLLWRKRTRNIAQIPAYLNGYWDMFKEKRNLIRFNMNMAVTCNLAEKDVSIYHAFSKNISGKGICLRATEMLPEGASLDLKIDVPDDKPIFIKGDVVWVKEARKEATGDSKERLFDIGIRFVKVDEKDKERLCNLLGLNAKGHKEIKAG